MKKVYITGKVEGMTKNEVRELVESKGFGWSSGAMDILVTADRAGEKRIENAKKRGAEIISWEEFKAKHLK